MKKMKTAELAKSLGANSLQDVADFYGRSPKHLREFHARNERAFKAMVIGYLEVIKG